MVLLTGIVAQKCRMNKAKKLKKNTTIYIYIYIYIFLMIIVLFQFSLSLFIFYYFLLFLLFLLSLQIYIFFIFIFLFFKIYVVAQQYQKPIRIKTQARLLLVLRSCLSQQQRDCLRQSSETKIYGCIRIERKTAISSQGISLFLQINITSI